MNSSLLVSSSSCRALEGDYHTIVANLANANTVAFKRRRNSFVQALRAATDSQGKSMLLPVKLESVASDFSTGALTQTYRKLDFAIDGEGLFVLETPDGPLYTSNGAFVLNSERQLCTTGGHTVSGDGGAIVIPENAMDITAGRDGTIQADGQSVGKIRIVKFEDTSVLHPVGANSFENKSQEQPTVADDAELLQGYREGSNVQPVKELVHLITVMRQYEMNLKVISKGSERSKDLIRVAGA